MLVSVNYLLILGTAWKWAFNMLLSSLRSSEKVSNMTLLDEVKRTTGGVQAPGPHHLKYYKNCIKKKTPNISHIPVIFAEKLHGSNTDLVICISEVFPWLPLPFYSSTQSIRHKMPEFPQHWGLVTQGEHHRCSCLTGVLEFSDL